MRQHPYEKIRIYSFSKLPTAADCKKLGFVKSLIPVHKKYFRKINANTAEKKEITHTQQKKKKIKHTHKLLHK